METIHPPSAPPIVIEENPATSNFLNVKIRKMVFDLHYSILKNANNITNAALNINLFNYKLLTHVFCLNWFWTKLIVIFIVSNPQTVSEIFFTMLQSWAFNSFF